MGRFWSLLFLMVPVFGVGVFVWAMAGWWPMHGHWLPENINEQGKAKNRRVQFLIIDQEGAPEPEKPAKKGK